MESLIRRLSMMYGSKPVYYDGIPLMITNVGDEPSTLVVEHIIEHELYYKRPTQSFYKPFPDNTLTIPSGETIHIFGYFVDVNTSNYAHFTFTGGEIHLKGSIRAIKSKASSAGVALKASYYSLFSKNLNIVSTSRDLFKEFSGVSLEESMFAFIFDGCSNLETAPDLYGNNNRGYTFEGSFRNCKNLKKLPVIYCKYVRGGTFRYTFNGCSSMDMVEEVTIPNSGGTSHTYTSMFDGCKSLTKLPNFTENGASYCNLMFNNCTNITDASNITLGVVGKAPALVAYVNMFAGCTNLIHAPKILVTTLGDERPSYWGAFNSCFYGCTKLDKLEVNFKDFTPSNFGLWVQGVSPTGTFVCPKELAEATDGYYDEEGNFVAGVGRGVDTVPEGWYIDYPIIDARDGDTNAMALMAVIFAQEWSKNSLYMMKSEAEKVEDIGTVFRDNKSIKNFEALKYFTKITSIPDNAFYGCSNLTKINIPIQVTHLGTKSFGTTPQLGKIPNHITTFGNLPFYYSTRTLIDISEIKVSSTGSIFQNMYKLGSIELPDQITEISDSAFSGCSALTSFHVHKDIAKIGARPFLNTNGSVKTITVADDNPIYDSRENCNAIIKTATNTLIAGCANTIIPYGIKEITSGALQGVGLESLTIPSSVTTIGSYCFSGYKGTFIEFPDTIVSNGTQIISDAPNLQEAIVGVNIVNIQSYSFYKCPNLTKLTLKAKSVVIAHNTSLTNTNANLVVYVPSELITAYQEDSFWSKFNIQAIPQ